LVETAVLGSKYSKSLTKIDITFSAKPLQTCYKPLQNCALRPGEPHFSFFILHLEGPLQGAARRVLID
jgi:hypothetical protein